MISVIPIDPAVTDCSNPATSQSASAKIGSRSASNPIGSASMLVTTLVNEINSKGIYFRQLTPKTTSKGRKTASKSK